ncbi:MAG: adventurous gliding motility lipoprotein CglC [Myxococcales bacterium]
MRFGLSIGILALGLAATWASCSLPSDLGQPCPLVTDGGDGGLLATTGDGGENDDYLYRSADCDNLVCVRSAGSALDAGYGVCSNNCTPDTPGAACGASQDCDTAHTGLVCRTLTIDPNFVKEILAEDGGAALLEEYLGGPNAMYCATATDAGC